MALGISPLRIGVVGGGPGGLYFASLVKQLDPRHEITVWERNAADDTFGFGVVFSDETLGAIEHADAEIYAQMQAGFASWADIDVHYRGRVITSGGHGFAAMSRHRLLDILQRRAAALGTNIHFRTEAPADLDGFDLVVAADGVNSLTRSRHEFGTSFSAGDCKFMWLGTHRVFDAFKFFIVSTEFGVMQAHAYPYSRDMSTFVVEMHTDVWRRSGLDAGDDRAWAPGDNDVDSIRRCEEIFAEALQGAELVGNNSRWINFVTVRNSAWRHDNVVLLGDAAHTAHFTIGSGTKLAMEDALALAACLHEHPDVDAALQAYEAERRPVVESTQRSAQASMAWFENLAQYVGQEPEQFAFNLLTRSRRITYANLRLRDPDYVDEVDDWFVQREHARGAMSGPSKPVPPMFLPFRLDDLELPNRVIVSPMDMYTATDGLIGDFHLVHLGSKALGGAGLVMTEMVCVCPEGRITPGCAGLYSSDHMLALRRVVDFVHDNSPAKVGIQLGHAGRKGSTKLMWEGMDEPLDDGNWPLVAPSPIPYLPVSQVPREMTREDMDVVREAFVGSAKMAAAIGFDLLELHCAHGYLLASFISPVSNVRTDAYGGSLENRLRYPLEVFDAVREVWPAGRPVTVRVSASDWVDGGLTDEESVDVARAFCEHGAAAIDVSTGQTTPDEAPAFGRSYQTPFADRIRNRLGVPTIAVGAISSFDDVNSIILAGRADLCALARAHLYDPAWTLHAAAEQDVTVPWPVQFERGNRKPPSGRTDGPRPRLELHRIDPDARRHERWMPGEATR